ncbi:MAG TPA: ABC transporter permease [Clostridia bacterium]|nr:ABC transporter permease [Clostridia bacterium]
MSMEKTKEPIVRISKRASIGAWRAWLIRIAALFASLVVCGVIIFGLTGLNPVAVYVAMFNGAFSTVNRTWVTVRDLMLLLCIGVGLAPAFKMRFWNIGAEGQILVGGIATAACMIYLGKTLMNFQLPLLLIMIAASALAGAVWGLIPAIFKARWNANETLFTLMMNYIAIQFTSYFVALWENPFGSNTVGIINQMTKSGWFPPIFKQMYLLNVLIVVALAAAMYLYLRYSKQGYEIAVVGESENTARYAAINVKKVVIRTMILSGAICGIAGFLAVAGMSHTISTGTAGGRGFIAIIVAWLAKFNTLVMALISGLLVFLDKGAIQIASQFDLNDFVSEMIMGIILCFILGSEFFINFKVHFRGKHKEDGK